MSRSMNSLKACVPSAVAVALLIAGASANAFADTRMMPDRQALASAGTVVWGNTSQANGTAMTLTCGDGNAPAPNAATVGDQSYIAAVCTYPLPGTYTATLTVGAEVASAKVTVVSPAPGSEAERNAKVNAAIEDGLRFLYQNQYLRATRFNTQFTSWDGNTNSNYSYNAFTAIAVQAIQNHGHSVNGPNTDIFVPVVQRGLNYLLDFLVVRDLRTNGVCDDDTGPDVRNPCVGVPNDADNYKGLSATPDGYDGYATGLFAAAISGAASADPNRLVGAGIGSANGNFVAGRKYSEVLQRIVNALIWGQNDSGSGRGGWYYSLKHSNSDGSTMGWALLGLFDAQAAGAVIPAWVKSEVATVLNVQLNPVDGTLRYQDYYGGTGNMLKVGTGILGLVFAGTPNDARVGEAKQYIIDNWSANGAQDGFSCYLGTPTVFNKGCGYAMFNVFKAMRLLGVTKLPGIGRPAGPGAIQADDWYADYVDNLLANQKAKNSPTGGQWDRNSPPYMSWSGYGTQSPAGISSLALLILSPVAFVQPDLVRFSTLGLSPLTATNPVNTDHTVTAEALSAALTGVPGIVIDFKVLTGPNAGKTGSGTTGANGKVDFTYHDDGGAGIDTIQAFIGQAGSNKVTKTWVLATIVCDVNADKVVNTTDLNLIRAKNGQKASGPNDPFDPNHDGLINLTDVRFCQQRLTPQ